MNTKFNLVYFVFGISIGLTVLNGCNQNSHQYDPAASFTNLSETDLDIDNSDTNLDDNKIFSEAKSNSNPCVNKYLFTDFKAHIRDQAMNEFTQAYAEASIGFSEGYNYDLSPIMSSDISFDYISEPYVVEGYGTECNAKVNITYHGDNNTPSNLASKIDKVLNLQLSQDQGDFFLAMMALDISTAAQIKNIGVDNYILSQFNRTADNTYSAPFNYTLQKTYDENGNEKDSYEIFITDHSKFLATLYAVDKYYQALAEKGTEEMIF